ncbi:carbon-phosphorus lyase complex subunit PhnI [Myxosarcina sp. GI1]|uniref:carbon-phosphorus lyase complex subunit PhnI n=1 Tax=Myxosarcina sp. GI1 TaxID=1541065 RepID=UPI0009E08F25|nr:carbon-phosphorus lyase complex subunit PhnI [Myxosarcina sp. GI1]
MAYVAVKGGEKAIQNAEALLQAMRRGDKHIPELSIEQIKQQLALAVDRVMAEGSLYDRDLAALAIKQSWGDLVEAIFLLRAYRTTLPRLYYSQPLNTEKMQIQRRISSIFKDVPEGQKLGATYDYIHRLLDFKLAAEDNNYNTLETDNNRDRNGKIARAIDTLDREGLIQSETCKDATNEPFDLTRQSLNTPTNRDARLQNLARADEGFLLGLAYSSQRGYGKNHPFAGEIRVGEVEVIIEPEELGFEIAIADIQVTEVQMLNQFKGSKELPPQFTRGYGLTFGYNERKAMSMAIVDRALRAKEFGENLEGVAQDEEFVLYHSDNVEAQGFVQHLKLPHYIDFQAELNLVRQMRKEQKINSLKIRAAEAHDYPAIAEVNNLAFGRENEAELVEKIRQSKGYVPELSLVAELDNKIVGHIMFSYIDLIDKETTQVLALAPVAVSPEHQNKEIGSLLIKTGLEIADKIPAPMVIVLGDPKFYIRFGFKPASKYSIQSPFNVPDEYFMVKFLTKSDGYRGKIVYPAAFSAV